MTLDVEAQIVDIKKVPVKEDVGFPQNLYMQVDNVTYRFTFGFNMIDGSLMLTIRRESDSVNILRGKVCAQSPIKIRSPDTWEAMFGLYATSVTRDNVKIWLIDQDTGLNNADLGAFING